MYTFLKMKQRENNNNGREPIGYARPIEKIQYL